MTTKQVDSTHRRPSAIQAAEGLASEEDAAVLGRPKINLDYSC
jgi:hypothetical protein